MLRTWGTRLLVACGVGSGRARREGAPETGRSLRLCVPATLEAGDGVVGTGRCEVEPICRGVTDGGLGEEDAEGCGVGPEKEAMD